MTSGFLNVAKKVLRQAVNFGIEEAGVRICGKTGWNAIKALVSPVIQELERRYPNLLLVPEKMDKAEHDLDNDIMLENIVQERLGAIEGGQKEILAVLFRNEETLSSYRNLFFNAFNEADKHAEERHKILISEIRKVKTDVEGEIRAIGKKSEAVVEPKATLKELYYQANGYQSDAITWLTDKQIAAATERLSIARTLAMGGMTRMGKSAELMTTMGYVEKTQAQVCFAENNIDGATRYLADAARFFNEALKLAPEDMSALNGIANIYLFGGDLDAAIEVGRTIMHTDENYGAAIWDLGLALEKKLMAQWISSNMDLQLLNEAIGVDEHLLKIIPQQPSSFRSSDLDHVQKRLIYYRNNHDVLQKNEKKVEDITLKAALHEAYQQQQEFHALFNANDIDDSLKFARMSLEYINYVLSKYPDEPYIRTLRGYCCKNEAMVLIRIGHHEEAKRSLDIADLIFQEILNEHPEDAMALHGRGNVEMLRNNWQTALQYIDRALELKPDYSAAKRDRITVLENLK